MRRSSAPAPYSAYACRMRSRTRSAPPSPLATVVHLQSTSELHVEHHLDTLLRRRVPPASDHMAADVGRAYIIVRNAAASSPATTDPSVNTAAATGSSASRPRINFVGTGRRRCERRRPPHVGVAEISRAGDRTWLRHPVVARVDVRVNVLRFKRPCAARRVEGRDAAPRRQMTNRAVGNAETLGD
jgi:hypothetical protein